MHKIWRIVTSIRLTVLLLGCAMALIFFATLDQVNFGIYEVQKRYFESFFVAWSYPMQWLGGRSMQWLFVPLPGGYLLGSLLLINLVCAHFKYFIPKWNKIGIVMIHLGLFVLIVSGFVTSFFQKESQMWLTEGETSRYSENIRENELVIIDKTDPQSDNIYRVPQNLFIKGKPVAIPQSPFTVSCEKFYPNAELGLRSQNPEIKEPNLATMGAGVKMDIVVFPRPAVYRQDEVNMATAYIDVKADGESIGVWLVSTVIDDRFPPQKFSYGGRNYEIALRFQRTYFPFSLKLLKFSHDKYPGTQIARNFSSSIQIIDPDKGVDRQVLIYMNNPLRYEGYTFYQASFGDSDTKSMLQVVVNPGWLLPYLSILLVGMGLVIHFMIHLIQYLGRRQRI